MKKEKIFLGQRRISMEVDLGNGAYFDTEAFSKDIKEKAKKKGVILTAYMPSIEEGDIREGTHITPAIEIKGIINGMTAAFLSEALDRTAKELAKSYEVEEIVEFIKTCATPQTIMLKNKKGGIQE